MVLEVNNLVKRYGKVTAVNSISFQVKPGQVFGILGPNGSGKTTTLGCITGILTADSGTFAWFDKGDFVSSRKKIGAMIETPNFYPYMSAEMNLEIVAHIKGTGYSRIHDTLKEVGLFERRNSPFKSFSLGMKQRLSIGSALLTDPEVLVLDEPTNGLDPQGINEIRQLIIRQRDRGKTIILASHLLNEVEKVCTDVVILKKGNVLKSATVAGMLVNGNTVEVGSEQPEILGKALEALGNLKISGPKNGRFVIELPAGYSSSFLNRALIEKGVSVNHIVQVQADLESEFLKLIG